MKGIHALEEAARSSVGGIEVRAAEAEAVADPGRLRQRIAELEAVAAGQRRRLRTVERSEASLRRLYESTILGVFAIDPGGNIVEANDVFHETVGYRRRDLPLRWAELMPPERRPEAGSGIGDLLAAGASELVEREYLRQDGSRVPVLVGAASPGGSRGEGIAVCIDLADPQRAHAALCACQERYRARYEEIPVMFFTLGIDGTVLEVNSYGAEQLGYRPEELVGGSVLEIFHPQDRVAVGEQLRGAVAQPGRILRWRFRKICKDGSVLWVREAVRVIEEDGRTKVLVVCEDVTEQVEAEEQLGRYQDQLRALTAEVTLAEARERRRIAEGLHDQTGQALVAARMQLGALVAAEADGGKRRALDEVRQLLAQALRQTRSLTFELSCPILYRLGLAAALQDLGEGLEREHGLRFHWIEHAPRGTGAGDLGSAPMAEDRKILLFRCVRELLSNVVKHARASTVRVSLRRAAGRLLIAVEDDGVGFDVSKPRSGHTATVGIGLFAIRERLRHLGGRLEIRTAAGGGSRASISVPLAPAEEVRADGARP